jgi:1,2-phenylacetyl-CoA epoxidase PaaB subunit
MAPDTEPTDEELALVMREARELAVQRRATCDAWVAARLREASIFARTNTQARRTDKPR